MCEVSVITSVYNGEAYFDRALPSILNQTYRNFEFLIVNDGSTDSTLEKLKAVQKKDERIKILNPGRVGFTKALNLAIRQSKGKYIFRQDFDDTSYPHRIEKQLSFLKANPEVGLVGGYYLLIDYNRKEKYVRMPPVEHHEIAKAMSQYIPFAHTLVAFRREAIRDAGGYDEHFNNITDLRTWIKIGAAGWKMANLPEVLGEHYAYEQSYWHKNFKYKYRQRELAGVQLQAVLKLYLPIWLLMYPLARLFYAYLPDKLKKVARRAVIGSKEQDI